MFSHNKFEYFVIEQRVCSRVRWFQILDTDFFGQPQDCVGYQKKHFGLYGDSWGGSLYPPQVLPTWQNCFYTVKKQVFGFLQLFLDLLLAIFTQTSSVTKRNIMDGMNKVLGTAYTPHQCSYSDRKIPYWEKSPNNDNMGVRVIIWGILMHMQFLYSFS